MTARVIADALECAPNPHGAGWRVASLDGAEAIGPWRLIGVN